MNNNSHNLIISRFCNEFESQLKSGEATTFDSVFEVAKRELKDEEVLRSLLSELMVLQITYSDNHDLAAGALREKFPEHGPLIDKALRQYSLGTIENAANRTRGSCRKKRSTPIARIANIGNRFENLMHHASGGLGDVYVGFDKAVRRNVAIKLLKPKLVFNQQAKGRFLNEGAITAMLEHPGIVPIYDSGVTEDGQPWYAMRLLEGQTLKDAIRQLFASGRKEDFSGRQRELLRALTQVCEAVSYSHDHGVIHRDLKPANVLLGKYGETMVIDWGLARKTDDESTDGEEPQSDSPDGSHEAAAMPDSPVVTALGQVVGTPAYMSPEQASGDSSKVSKQSDVYSLGCILYCILTSRSPLKSAAVLTQEVIETIQQGDYPTAKELNAAVPESLSAICERAMKSDPNLRYESPKALAFDIENWLEDRPVVARPDTVVEKFSRFVRKHRRWSVAAVTTLVAITIGLSIATAVISSQSKELARRKLEAEAQSEVQAKLATKNEELAERERVTGLKSRQRMAVLRSYIRLAIQEDGDFSKGKLRELILDRVGRFKHSASTAPSNLKEHVDTGVFSLSLITDHKAALDMYKEFAELRASFDDGKLSTQVYAAVEEAKLLSAAGQSQQAIELLEAKKSDAIGSLGIDHDATQELLRNLVYGLRGDDNIVARQDAISLLCPWLPESDCKGVPDSLTIEEIRIGGFYARNLCILGEVGKGSSVFSAIYETASGKFGATQVHTLECLQYHAEAVEIFGTLEQALPPHRLLAKRLAEEYGDASPRTALIRMQLLRQLFRSDSYSEAVELAELVRSSVANETFMRKKELLLLDALYARSLLHVGRVDEATAILEDFFGEESSSLELKGRESLRKRFELAQKKPVQLIELAREVGDAIAFSKPKWNPYIPLTVPGK